MEQNTSSLPIMNISAIMDKEGKISSIEFFLQVATKEDAKAFAATFPKSCKMLGTTISGFFNDYSSYKTYGFVVAKSFFKSDGVNKGINESGLKRAKKIFSLIDPRFEKRYEWHATEAQIREFLK